MRIRSIVCAGVLLTSFVTYADDGVPKQKSDRQVVEAGVNGVTNPRLIKESFVEPQVEGCTENLSTQVILKAVIEIDGKVSNVKVKRCDRPGLGLEESAIEAVKQWRYKPAMKDGEPVAVHLIVVIDFELRWPPDLDLLAGGDGRSGS